MANQSVTNTSHTSSRSWVILSMAILVLGPLVALAQLQYGNRISEMSALRREISAHELTLSHAGTVRDVTMMHPEDILLLDSTIPQGKRHDTLLVGLVQVARQQGAEVQSLSLNESNVMNDLTVPGRFRPVMQEVEFTLSGVTYEKLSRLLQDVANARRPMVVDKWQYDAKAGTVTMTARTVVIEPYATY